MKDLSNLSSILEDIEMTNLSHEECNELRKMFGTKLSSDPEVKKRVEEEFARFNKVLADAIVESEKEWNED